MRFILTVCAGIFATLALFHPRDVEAGVLIPVVPPAGSMITSVGDINDSNVIAGDYVTSDGVDYAFFGTLAGDYTTFDYGANGTQARAINNSGYITGITNPESADVCKFGQFERSPDGSIVDVMKDGMPLHGVVQGIDNLKNKFVGEYCDAQGKTLLGYRGKSGNYKKGIDLSVDTTQVRPRGTNTAKTVVGLFLNDTGRYSGFVLEHGKTTVIDYPDGSERETKLEDINDQGVAVGFWAASDGRGHGFTLDTISGTFTPITVPGATIVEPFGINNAGLVALITNDSVGAYIYCPHSKRKCPGNGQEIRAAKPIHAISRNIRSKAF